MEELARLPSPGLWEGLSDVQVVNDDKVILRKEAG